ncbi:MAG: hypothetical protein GX020_06240 [Firmicutes bacterium]|nr:hypothetical protein [Bacillota bacterium]
MTARLIRVSERISYLVSNEKIDVNQGSIFSQLEEQLLQETIRAFPQYFQGLAKFKEQFQEYPIEHVRAYSYELRFNTAMINMINKLKLHGFGFCKPEIIKKSERQVHLKNVYDLSLALSIIEEGKNADSIVCNNHSSDETGRVFILTGPNQGGKTTFLRSLGLTQVLFQAGCFVPAEVALLSTVDQIFTHFSSVETDSDSGRLEEEMIRFKQIMQQVSGNSLLLMNESFSSTNAREGAIIAEEFLKALSIIGTRVVFVTHLYEIAKRIDKINAETQGKTRLVSMVAGVEVP